MSWIFHVTAATDWEAAVAAGEYRLSTRGKTLVEQGFIHASTAEQVEGVANAVYRGSDGLVVVVIDANRVSSEIRYERPLGSEEEFPHIYGPLNIDAVVGTFPLDPGTDGLFNFHLSEDAILALYLAAGEGQD